MLNIPKAMPLDLFSAKVIALNWLRTNINTPDGKFAWELTDKEVLTLADLLMRTAN